MKNHFKSTKDKEEIYSLNEKYTAFYIQNEAKFKMVGQYYQVLDLKNKESVTATETTNTLIKFLPSNINYMLNDMTNLNGLF